MPDTGAPYFIPYVEPTDLVRDYPDASEDLALAIVAALENIPVIEKRIEAFTGSGNWTVPAGVTYAIAHMRGGGGGAGTSNTGGAGGASSVAFAGGTVTAAGGNGILYPQTFTDAAQGAAANSGYPATMAFRPTLGDASVSNDGQSHGAVTVAGNTVTPAATVAVVVGAGGSAGTSGAAGGSGYVYIEYYEEV
jgi:hypothetical protein